MKRKHWLDLFHLSIVIVTVIAIAAFCLAGCIDTDEAMPHIYQMQPK